MNKLIAWYLRNWYNIIFRPIYFFTFMEKGSYKEKSFSFMLISGGLLSLAASIAVFFLVILQLISPVLLGAGGMKTFVIMPVFVLLCLSFFVIVFLVILSVVISAMTFFFGVIGMLLHYSAWRAGGAADAKEAVKAAFYSSAVLIGLCLVPVTAFAERIKMIPGGFVVGTNILMYMAAVYLWGLWSIAVKKIYNFERSKALTSTFFVFLIVLLLMLAVSFKVLPKLERWVG